MERLKTRAIMIGVFFSLLFIGIAAKAVHLQVFQSDILSQRAHRQYAFTYEYSGKRGTIYDTNHKEMAVSIDATSIAAFPKRIEHKGRAAYSLAKALNLPIKKIKAKLYSSKSFVWVARQVTPKKIEAVQKLNIYGVEFLPEHGRYYPNKALASQVLGFSGVDGKGLEGIEFYYDDILKGQTIKATVLKDALGRKVGARDFEKEEIGGTNLVLTIDRTIQYIAETALLEAYKTFHAKSGIAIVMSPKTGAILAMVNVPGFNPNAFGRYRRQQWKNRSVTDAFEPGSIMKIFLAAAAIESEYCTPNSIFYCENGAYRVGRNIVHDTHKHEWLSLQQIIKYSSNIGAVKISEITGKQKLSEYLVAFGFGKETGIDCPGETRGFLAPYQRWTKIDTGTISFGQGVSVSAIQLVTAAAAIANGGQLMRPYMVRAYLDQKGKLLKSIGPKVKRRVISARTAATVRKIMGTVVTEGGTGENAAITEYRVAGKTGTAQKVINGKYANDKYVASFLGFAPLEDPEIVALVALDEPQGRQYYGGVVAAPAFRKIVLDALNYLNVHPKNKDILMARCDHNICGEME